MFPLHQTNLMARMNFQEQSACLVTLLDQLHMAPEQRDYTTISNTFASQTFVDCCGMYLVSFCKLYTMHNTIFSYTYHNYKQFFVTNFRFQINISKILIFESNLNLAWNFQIKL